MLALAILLLPSAAPLLQQADSGFEMLKLALDQRTAQRRQAAQRAWAELGPAYLAQPSRGTLAPLLDYAPEIQQPVLAALADALSKPSEPSPIPSLLQLLESSLNPTGAAQLLAQVPQLPNLQQLPALRMAIAHGGPRSWSQAKTYLSQLPSALGQTALESLLLAVPPAATLELLPYIRFERLDLGVFGATLDALSERDLPPNFQLPATAYEQSDPEFLSGLVVYLSTHPQADAENFLLDRILDRNKLGLSSEARQEALTAYEVGAATYRWRLGLRQLTRALKELPRSPLSLNIAWSLHRLGEKAGKNYLLARPEAEAKRNPDDWRAQFALAKLQVDVGEFGSAYRNYRKTLESLEGTPVIKRVESMDYFYAARAAAGAKHSKEAGQWLLAARLRPDVLAKYRDLPEFQPYLKKAPFNRLFPVAD